jgi:hypothetical protein
MHVATIGAGLVVAVAGGTIVANPKPTNPYKKKGSNTTGQNATTAELLSYFDKVMPEDCVSESSKAKKSCNEC